MLGASPQLRIASRGRPRRTMLTRFHFWGPGGNTRWRQLDRRERAAAENQRREKAIRCRRPSEVNYSYGEAESSLPIHNFPAAWSLRSSRELVFARTLRADQVASRKGAYLYIDIYIQGWPGWRRTGVDLNGLSL